MRIFRWLALALIALAAPFSRGIAQTCEGSAAFQDGRVRLGADDQYNSDLNDVRGTLGYGIPRSFFAGVSVDQIQITHGGGSMTGVGANLGYQIHLSDTPFQLCPVIWTRSASGSGNDLTQFAYGATIGYRVNITDWFSFVPAAGIWAIRTNLGYKVNVVQPTGTQSTSDLLVNGTASQVMMALGLVFNRELTVTPGILVPSQSGAKSIYTLGVSVNWAQAVPR